MNAYRSLAEMPDYTFRLGKKVKVVNIDSTHWAKLGETGTLVGDCNHPEHPGWPSRGWVVRFKGLPPWDFLLLWGWLGEWRREEHMFEWQLELVD